MENRRAYFRLLLVNFAAAFYNLAAQWMTQILLVNDLGPRRALLGIYFPAFMALVFSAWLLNRKPRGVDRTLLAGGFGIQITLWVLVGLSHSYELPAVLIWLELILVLVYAMLSWKALIGSYRTTVSNKAA